MQHQDVLERPAKSYMQSIPAAAKVFMIILMMVGGTAFSTAGGIKVGRFVILYQEFAKRIGMKRSEMHQSTAIHEAYSSISSTANPHRSEDNGILERIREEYRTRDFREILQKHGKGDPHCNWTVCLSFSTHRVSPKLHCQ